MSTKQRPSSTNAAIYTRISSDPTGQRAGVTRQLEDCRDLADRLGWTVVETFTDNDRSAHSGKPRPGFEALLDAIKRGEVDAVIVWHTDRLYRRLHDLVRLLDVAAGVEIRTVNGGDLDLSTATGRMLATILGSVGAQEVEHKAERRRRANAQRRAQGRWNPEGFRTFGYTRDGQLVHDEADALRRAGTDVLNGTSLRSICLDWNRRGLTTSRGCQWTNLRLRRVLANPLYAGIVVYQGKTLDGVTGEWDALWDRETHHALVNLLSSEDRRPAAYLAFTRQHMLSGVAFCGKCGAKLYAQPYKDRPSSYVCRANSHLGRMAAPLDAYVEKVVLKLLSRSDIRKRLTDREDVDVDGLRAKRKGLTAQKDKLATLFMEGVLTEAGVRRESAKLTEQIEGINRVLAEAVRTSPAAAMLADGVDQLAEHWDAASADIRSKVVDELMVVTVLPVPAGHRGVLTDPETGEKVIRTDYVSITPR